MGTRRTIAGVPEIVDSGVEEFRQKQGLQSWSQSAIVLLALGINAIAPDDGGAHFGGSNEAENLLWEQYDVLQRAGDKRTFIEWLTDELTKPWGGQRENAGRKEEE